LYIVIDETAERRQARLRMLSKGKGRHLERSLADRGNSTAQWRISGCQEEKSSIISDFVHGVTFFIMKINRNCCKSTSKY